jgi:NADH-quinone oxidoreductase subunit C
MNAILDGIKERFGDALLESIESYGMATAVVEASSVYSIVSWLRDEQGYGFLTDICGIHYPESEKQLGVVYHLHNFKDNQRVRLKTFVTKENPAVASLTPLFMAANWMERETFDFFGIMFEGHPNLTRILNVDYLDYHPLRKEYPLEDPTREDKEDSFFGR